MLASVAADPSLIIVNIAGIRPNRDKTGLIPPDLRPDPREPGTKASPVISP